MRAASGAARIAVARSARRAPARVVIVAGGGMLGSRGLPPGQTPWW